MRFFDRFKRPDRYQSLLQKIERLERIVDSLLIERAYKIVARESVSELYEEALILINQTTHNGSYNRIRRYKLEQETFARLINLKSEVKSIEEDFPQFKELK